MPEQIPIYLDHSAESAPLPVRFLTHLRWRDSKAYLALVSCIAVHQGISDEECVDLEAQPIKSGRSRDWAANDAGNVRRAARTTDTEGIPLQPNGR